jgi:hypothetical protein
MTAGAFLARQALRTTGGDGSHMAVEDAVSAQFGAEIPAFTKPTFERLKSVAALNLGELVAGSPAMTEPGLVLEITIPVRTGP